MRLDLTPTIELDQKKSSLYQKMRVFLYVFSLLLGTYLAFRIFFPSMFFEFSFNNPNAKSNTLTNIRNEKSVFPEKGSLDENGNLIFDASLTGNYSTAIVTLALDKKSAGESVGNLSVKKSYDAFLYPEGTPMGFRDGTLLKNKGDFYMVSDGKLRKFSDMRIIEALGFSAGNFLEVQDNELDYNPKGDNIDKNSSYPDDSLFLIGDDLYQLQDNSLKKFISDSAYFTHYKLEQAIKKNSDFLQAYPISEDLIGFADGSLISYADSIYVVDDGKISPIDNPLTFSGKGFDWKDVIQASADEIALYGKEKLYTISNDHPDGTIFTTTEDHLHYLIIDGQKRLLTTENIFASWKNTTPIEVSRSSLDIKSSCQLKKSFWSSDVFECSLPIAEMQPIIGSDYVFSLESAKKNQFDLIDVEFKKDVGFANFRFTVSEILNRIRNNYAR